MNFIKASNFCSHITDGTHDSPIYQNNGYKLVTSKFIKNNRIDFSNAPCISISDFEKINLRSKVEINDILFSMIGTIGEVALVSDNSFAIKNMGLFRCHNELDAKYLFYYLQSSKAKEYIEESKAGSTQQYLTLNSLKMFPVPIFEVEYKYHIVDILGTLDEKIDFFDKQIRLLEKQGQLFYQDIFESSKFKTEKVDLAKIAVFQNGYSYSGDELCETSADCLATIKNFDRQGGFKIDGFKPIKVAGKIKPEMYAEVGDLLVAHTDLTQNADIIGNPALLLNTSMYKRVIISMDLVKVNSNTLSNELLYYILKSDKFKGHARGYCSGTTVLHLNKKALQEYMFDMPIDKEVVLRLEKHLSAIFDRIKSILKEIKQLKKLKSLYLKKFFD